MKWLAWLVLFVPALALADPPNGLPSVAVNGQMMGQMAAVTHGQSVAIAISNAPGADPHDQVQIYNPLTGAVLGWGYLNDSQTPPAAAATSGTVHLTAPASTGNYSIVLLAKGHTSIMPLTVQ